MNHPEIRGYAPTGGIFFTAYLDQSRNYWLYTHRNMAGLIGKMHGGLEGLISYMLTEFPDTYNVEYRDDNGTLHTSMPECVVVHSVAKLVAEELTRGR